MSTPRSRVVASLPLLLAACGRPAPASAPGTLGPLLLAALLFVGGHLLLSTGPIRTALVARLKPQGFAGFYAMIAFGSLIWLVVAWIRAPQIALWTAPPWTRWLALIGLLPVLVLMVAGFTQKSPTAAGQEGLLARDDCARGILTITRHPGLWSFALLGLLHLPANGDLATVVLFGGVALLSLVGMLHIDARRARSHGAHWQRFAAKTSRVPFVAALAGRTRIDWGGIGLKPLVIGLLLYAIFVAAHPHLFGTSALPAALLGR